MKEQGYTDLIRSVYEDGKNVSFTIYYDSSKLEHLNLKNYAHVILDVTIFPIKDSDGNITNAVIQHKNITLRKQIEENFRLMKKLILFCMQQWDNDFTKELAKEMKEQALILEEI